VGDGKLLIFERVYRDFACLRRWVRVSKSIWFFSEWITMYTKYAQTQIPMISPTTGAIIVV
jgi:hypothetical protein